MCQQAHDTLAFQRKAVIAYAKGVDVNTGNGGLMDGKQFSFTPPSSHTSHQKPHTTHWAEIEEWLGHPLCSNSSHTVYRDVLTKKQRRAYWKEEKKEGRRRGKRKRLLAHHFTAKVDAFSGVPFLQVLVASPPTPHPPSPLPPPLLLILAGMPVATAFHCCGVRSSLGHSCLLQMPIRM